MLKKKKKPLGNTVFFWVFVLFANAAENQKIYTFDQKTTRKLLACIRHFKPVISKARLRQF